MTTPAILALEDALGIISQVTLKLRPLAEETALVLVRCELSALDGLLNGLQLKLAGHELVAVGNLDGLFWGQLKGHLGHVHGLQVFLGFGKEEICLYFK